MRNLTGIFNFTKIRKRQNYLGDCPPIGNFLASPSSVADTSVAISRARAGVSVQKPPTVGKRPCSSQVRSSSSRRTRLKIEFSEIIIK